MKPFLYAVYATALLGSNAFATTQTPDKILYEGKQYSFYVNFLGPCFEPLEPYFDRHPERRPRSEAGRTDLHRGYVATFAVKEDVLVVEDIEILARNRATREESWKSVKDEVVPEGGDLPADWFTETLVLSQGELVKDVQKGPGSFYRNYILLEIQNGKLAGKRTVDHEQYMEFRRKEFQAYTQTGEYEEAVARLTEEGWKQDYIDWYLRELLVRSISVPLDEDEVDSPNEPVGREEKSWGPVIVYLLGVAIFIVAWGSLRVSRRRGK